MSADPMPHVADTRDRAGAGLFTGEDLRYLREQAGLTQQALAARFGCARATILRWEHGARRIPEHEYTRLLDVLETALQARRDWQRGMRHRLHALHDHTLA